jgi:ABC-type sugar transport system permease subunit
VTTRMAAWPEGVAAERRGFAFKALDMGFAAAASFILAALILAVTLLSLRYVRGEVAYQ